MPLDFPAIPGFQPAADIVAAAVRETVAVRRRLTVPEAAARYRWLDNRGGGYTGPWRHDEAPQTVLPMLCLTDPRYSMVAIMGPAQSGKSEVANNWLLYTVVEDPANMVWYSTDKELLRSYVVGKINPMMTSARDPDRPDDDPRRPVMLSRLMPWRGADGILRKSFMGATIEFAWPVGAQFRMRSAPRAVLDDFDGIPQEMPGEGSTLMLVAGRQTTFEGSEGALILSSPALGSAAGIEELVARGTDFRARWRCQQCDEYWELDILRDLQFDRTAEAEDAARTARVVCPCCGFPHEQRHKRALKASEVFAAKDQHVLADGTVEGPVRETHIASFRWDGLIGFSTFGKLARDWREAELALEDRQDEADLRAWTNTKAGKNYRAAADEGASVTDEDLIRRSGGCPLGFVPPWVRCLTAAVDIGGRRFDVMVMGWGERSESCIVDRFALRQLPDGRTDLDPAGHAEHWDVLIDRVLRAHYPLQADPALALPILITAVDTGGLDGVTDNAMAFQSRARAAGIPESALALVKGGSKPNGPVLPPPTPLQRDSRGRALKRAVKLYVPNVHRVKNILDTRIGRADPGPGYIHLPAGFEARWCRELRAETKEDGVWVRHGANETWDLAVYNIVALMVRAGNRTQFNWLPSDYRAVALDRPALVPSPAPAAAAAPDPLESRAHTVALPEKPARIADMLA